MEALISPILINLFWFVIICLSWRHNIARHIALVGAWSQICLTIAETYYPQFLQIAVYSMLIVWALFVILINWLFCKIVTKDNQVMQILFFSCALFAFSYFINTIAVPKFYHLGVLMTAISYLALAGVTALNKKLTNYQFYLSGCTVALAFLVGNTLHLMIEWTALVFFFHNILYIVAFLLFLLGILGFFLMYYRKVAFLSFVSAYAFGFVMGYYGYSLITAMQKLFA